MGLYDALEAKENKDLQDLFSYIRAVRAARSGSNKNTPNINLEQTSNYPVFSGGVITTPPDSAGSDTSGEGAGGGKSLAAIHAEGDSAANAASVAGNVLGFFPGMPLLNFFSALGTGKPLGQVARQSAIGEARAQEAAAVGKAIANFIALAQAVTGANYGVENGVYDPLSESFNGFNNDVMDNIINNMISQQVQNVVGGEGSGAEDGGGGIDITSNVTGEGGYDAGGWGGGGGGTGFTVDSGGNIVSIDAGGLAW